MSFKRLLSFSMIIVASTFTNANTQTSPSFNKLKQDITTQTSTSTSGLSNNENSNNDSTTTTTTSTNVDHAHLFKQYQNEHNKQYKAEDYPARLAAFQHNYELVQRHNEEFNRGLHKYKLAMNQFADLSNEEYRSLMLGFHVSSKTMNSLSDSDSDHDGSNKKLSSHEMHIQSSDKHFHTFDALPAAVDWRSRNVITTPKNQGGCGACWAFAAAAAIEGAHALKTGELIDLSPQALVDCVNGGANTCTVGGEMIDAYSWVINQNGIPTESTVPYQMKSGLECRHDSAQVAARINSYGNVTRYSEESLQYAIANFPGISIGIDAGQPTFQLYSEGVYDEPNCKQRLGELNHGVLAVGYGHDLDANMDYYLIKNSWGPWWGQGGYLKMARNKNNQCGVATDASYPIISP